MGPLDLLSSTLLSCFLASSALAATVSTQLKIANKEVNLDGFSRPYVQPRARVDRMHLIRLQRRPCRRILPWTYHQRKQSAYLRLVYRLG